MVRFSAFQHQSLKVAFINSFQFLVEVRFCCVVFMLRHVLSSLRFSVEQDISGTGTTIMTSKGLVVPSVEPRNKQLIDMEISDVFLGKMSGFENIRFFRLKYFYKIVEFVTV